MKQNTAKWRTAAIKQRYVPAIRFLIDELFSVPSYEGKDFKTDNTDAIELAYFWLNIYAPSLQKIKNAILH